MCKLSACIHASLASSAAGSRARPPANPPTCTRACCSAGFARAVKLRSLAPPADPATPACQHFGPCGGCQLQALDYAAQLRHKQEHVAELLRKVGKVEDAEGGWEGAWSGGWVDLKHAI